MPYLTTVVAGHTLEPPTTNHHHNHHCHHPLLPPTATLDRITILPDTRPHRQHLFQLLCASIPPLRRLHSTSTSSCLPSSYLCWPRRPAGPWASLTSPPPVPPAFPALVHTHHHPTHSAFIASTQTSRPCRPHANRLCRPRHSWLPCESFTASSPLDPRRRHRVFRPCTALVPHRRPHHQQSPTIMVDSEPNSPTWKFTQYVSHTIPRLVPPLI